MVWLLEIGPFWLCSVHLPPTVGYACQFSPELTVWLTIVAVVSQNKCAMWCGLDGNLFTTNPSYSPTVSERYQLECVHLPGQCRQNTFGISLRAPKPWHMVCVCVCARVCGKRGYIETHVLVIAVASLIVAPCLLSTIQVAAINTKCVCSSQTHRMHQFTVVCTLDCAGSHIWACIGQCAPCVHGMHEKWNV